MRDERNREKEREGEREKRKEGSEIEKQTGVRWREREREREIMLMCCLFFIRLSIYFIRHEFIVVNVYSYLFLYLPHFLYSTFHITTPQSKQKDVVVH